LDLPDTPPDTPPHLLAIRDELAGREPIFHRPEFGTSRAALEAMTDEGFWEVGASGTRYGRQLVIDTVVRRFDGARANAHETMLEADQWRTEDFRCRELGPGYYLLTYTLRQGRRVTRRATLWRLADGGWKIVYHQGTVVSEP
jgi:hypothetical protein